LSFCIDLFAQSTKTVQVSTPGTLVNYVSDAEKKTIKSLTVTGNIDSRDIAFIRDNLKVIETLDLTGSGLISYKGDKGTITGKDTLYRTDELPAYSFYNPFFDTYKTTLKTVKLPSKTSFIGDLAFYYCWNLTGQISIPSTVKSISKYAFYGCHSITAFSVSSSNTRYSGNNGVLFSKNQDTLFLCPNNKSGSYTIPSTVKRIHDSAFENCNSINSITMPASVISIGSYAFCNCTGMTGNLVIPESVTTIEDGAFSYCDKITGTVTLPSSLTKLGSYCFFESDSIQNFSINGNSRIFTSVNGILYSKNIDTLFICPGAKKGNLTIPASVKVLGSHSFYNCSGISGKMYIPASIDQIGYYSFYNCKNITEYETDPTNMYFTTENGMLMSKSKDRFLVCPVSKKGSITIPETTKYLDPCAFGFCSSITGDINLPSNLEYIGKYAFFGCNSINGFIVDETNKYLSSIDGILTSKLRDTIYICPASKTGIIELPGSVKFIGESSFYGCDKLTEVRLPVNLEGIGNYAFTYCNSLKKIVIPATSNKLGYGCFSGCTSLADFQIGLVSPPVIDYYFLDSIDKSNCKLTVPVNSSGLYKNAPYWENFSNIYESDFSSTLSDINKSDLIVRSINKTLHLNGLIKGNNLRIFNINGKLIFKRIIEDSNFSITLPEKGIVLIDTGGEKVKIMI
jgi:hypothetical protein